jgi:phosphoribosylglycinamide formyltransferase-1
MTNGRTRVGVLISGRGSNLKALLGASMDPAFPAAVVGVLSNRPNAAGLAHARAVDVPTAVVDHGAFDTREAFEAEVQAVLRDWKVEIVCLAGFMRLLTPGFVEEWHDQLINIHPSLLPAFPGLDTHARALAAGVRITGCTVHFVRTEMDDGPIIAQAAVPVLPNDTEEALAARVLEAEHRLYPAALALVASGRVRVASDNVVVSDRLPNLPEFLFWPPA